MARRWVCALAACLGGLALAEPAGATRIFYEAVDLPDAGGGDLWRYRYFVSDFAFAADQGFSIEFEVGLYESLQDPPPAVSLDWDILALQPDSGVPDAGLYDALALVDSPSLAQAFEVDFTWLGAGSPGSQPFAVNAFDASGGFVAELDSGVTELLPEPGLFALVACALACALVRR